MLQAIIDRLPTPIWYLSSNGTDLWCRKPYSFLFSAGTLAEAFAEKQASELGLVAIGVPTKDLITEACMGMLREQSVTRVFVDPRIDPDSGDVFGTILRIDDN